MADGVLVLRAPGRRRRDREPAGHAAGQGSGAGRAESGAVGGIIDSQSGKGVDTVGQQTRGYDAGEKVNGRKRFIITDTAGLLVSVAVMVASWQDRDGAKTALVGAYLAGVSRNWCKPDRTTGARSIGASVQPTT
ncbi:transposase [Micromonospora sp. NPDC049274]|uniref:transposase n=1 Tax=Micromonospora sp. NPDC049274 TaxID=3154829 RepID=UPI003415141C